MPFIFAAIGVACFVGAIILLTSSAEDKTPTQPTLPTQPTQLNQPNRPDYSSSEPLKEPSSVEPGTAKPAALRPPEPLIKIPEPPSYTTSYDPHALNPSIITPLEILFSFQGRIKRSQWWVFHLLLPLLFIGIAIPLALLKMALAVFFFIAIVPAWCICALDIKRWHDRDKSGWWMFIIFFPIIGQIWALIELGFLPGTEGKNTYGRQP